MTRVLLLQVPSNYIETATSFDLYGWVDTRCARSSWAVCEFEGELFVIAAGSPHDYMSHPLPSAPWPPTAHHILAVTGACSAPAPPMPLPCPSLASVIQSTRSQLVYWQNSRIYIYNTTGNLDYAAANAACSVLSFPGLTGKGYLVSWNT